MNITLNKDFWDKRYEENETGWDLGRISDPLKGYIDQLEDKTLKILIPGCGNSYEAEYLLENGFTDVTLIDISKEAVKSLTQKFVTNPEIKIIEGDFFEHEGQYDLILEQTFFCALDPVLREKYATHMHKLLKPGGKLVGVLFNCIFEKEGPPFGGSDKEYFEYFKTNFEIKIMNQCFNSIAPRSGNELFILLVAK
ncbi:MAG: methyltransferase domain-containing protein [Saprospiraceae bacterium]|jgi:SAM-dependent methyltransferase|nr:methyltransferase domain-containing protein [Saprospiraceae bacterium]